jgi:hypothetical protein
MSVMEKEIMSTIEEYCELIYDALLSLYPVQFRVRFGPEMVQVFRDCCHEALREGEFTVLAAFLLEAFMDLSASILRERSRQIAGPLDAMHPVISAVDSLLIPTIVLANLAALGPILTLVVQGGSALRIPMDKFVLTSGFFSFVIGTLAIAASLIFSRLRPTVRLWVKLSA